MRKLKLKDIIRNDDIDALHELLGENPSKEALKKLWKSPCCEKISCQGRFDFEIFHREAYKIIDYIWNSRLLDDVKGVQEFFVILVNDGKYNLLKKYIEAPNKNYEGDTATYINEYGLLHIACGVPCPNQVEMIRFLISQGADINRVNKVRDLIPGTPIYYLIKCFLQKSQTHPNSQKHNAQLLAILTLFIAEPNFNINASIETKDSMTIGCFAATAGLLLVLKWFNENGGNLNLTDGDNLTLLTKAIIGNSGECIEYLFSQDVELTSESVFSSPLFISMEKGQPKVFEELWKRGARFTLDETVNQLDEIIRLYATKTKFSLNFLKRLKQLDEQLFDEGLSPCVRKMILKLGDSALTDTLIELGCYIPLTYCGESPIDKVISNKHKIQTLGLLLGQAIDRENAVKDTTNRIVLLKHLLTHANLNQRRFLLNFRNFSVAKLIIHIIELASRECKKSRPEPQDIKLSELDINLDDHESEPSKEIKISHSNLLENFLTLLEKKMEIYQLMQKLPEALFAELGLSHKILDRVLLHTNNAKSLITDYFALHQLLIKNNAFDVLVEVELAIKFPLVAFKNNRNWIELMLSSEASKHPDYQIFSNEALNRLGKRSKSQKAHAIIRIEKHHLESLFEFLNNTATSTTDNQNVTALPLDNFGPQTTLTDETISLLNSLVSKIACQASITETRPNDRSCLEFTIDYSACYDPATFHYRLKKTDGTVALINEQSLLTQFVSRLKKLASTCSFDTDTHRLTLTFSADNYPDARQWKKLFAKWFDAQFISQKNKDDHDTAEKFDDNDDEQSAPPAKAVDKFALNHFLSKIFEVPISQLPHGLLSLYSFDNTAKVNKKLRAHINPHFLYVNMGAYPVKPVEVFSHLAALIDNEAIFKVRAPKDKYPALLVVDKDILVNEEKLAEIKQHVPKALQLAEYHQEQAQADGVLIQQKPKPKQDVSSKPRDSVISNDNWFTGLLRDLCLDPINRETIFLLLDKLQSLARVKTQRDEFQSVVVFRLYTFYLLRLINFAHSRLRHEFKVSCDHGYHGQVTDEHFKILDGMRQNMRHYSDNFNIEMLYNMTATFFESIETHLYISTPYHVTKSQNLPQAKLAHAFFSKVSNAELKVPQYEPENMIAEEMSLIRTLKSHATELPFYDSDIRDSLLFCAEKIHEQMKRCKFTSAIKNKLHLNKRFLQVIGDISRFLGHQYLITDDGDNKIDDYYAKMISLLPS